MNPWDQPKYLTIMLSDDAPKIYGLDTVKKDEKIYIVEGPSTPRSWKTLLLCAGPMLILGRLIGAIIFGFLITNHVTEKSSTGYVNSSIEDRK